MVKTKVTAGIESKQQRSQMQKFTPFLVFLFISIAFAYGLGVQGLEEQGHRASWPKFEATIIGSEIKTGHYNLNWT